MIEINIDNKTIRGAATVRDIKEKGLIKASIGDEDNE